MIKRETLSSLLNPQTAFGVLTDREVLLVDLVQGRRVLSTRLLPLDSSELSRLFSYLWDSGLRVVWVMPTASLSQTATCALFEQVASHWMVLAHADPHEPSRPSCVLLWPKGRSHEQGRRLTLSFPAYAGWDWRIPDARGLLATVTYLDQALATPVFDAAERVANQLLTQLVLDQAASPTLSSSMNLPTLAGRDGHSVLLQNAVRDLIWMRPLSHVEQRQRYLHKYSHFSHLLEACLAVQLGAGVPQYSSTGRACNGVRPGIWHVRTELAGSVFDGKRLPNAVDGAWMSTPQVNCCRDIGYRVDVEEGYYWPEAKAQLKQWATTLWQAASRLHTHPELYRHAQGRTNASHTIKLLAQLGAEILLKEQAVGGWSRPDWWIQILGRSRALLFAHLVALVRKGTMPVLVNGDALWVVSDDPNPLTAVPGLVTPQRWRGYSVGYEVPLPLSREVREVFSAANQAGQRAMALDTLAGEMLL
jgi:hypothetical protein